MILFIFEGKYQEPRIYKTIKKLFLPNINEEEILHYFCSNIYALYNTMKEYDVFEESADLVNILREKSIKHPEIKTDLDKITYSSEISEIYLFFDYDIKPMSNHNKLTVEEQNKQVRDLLNYFNDETRGKLYINYPMVESFRYFKNPLPDDNYKEYTVDVFIDGAFKEKAANDSYYKNLDSLCFSCNKAGNLKLPKEQQKIDTIRKNWDYIRELNIKKANYITKNNYSFPIKKEDINQTEIFQNQIDKYIIPKKEISILNSFPLWLYEYIDASKL